MSEFGGVWKHEKTQHALFNYLGLGSATLLQLAFLWGKRPEFPMGEIPIGTTKCTKYKYKIDRALRICIVSRYGDDDSDS